MTAIDLPAYLIDLERACWEAIREQRLTPGLAHDVQARITAWARETGHDRYVVEAAVKKAVRHPG
ncbi:MULTISPECIES: hypothetical protein [unclassified Streptomyces]|uniref:hypothetical protein n=1 Tax=unclassified Streptomyces TaxID=2593676 RepID=UPI000DD8E64B|nr:MULTISPECIES: hypothetical protein [unclassified Streptomyces]QZZ26502.1 hypothetical protein A7X85_09770 [Streptomyces sp. ST1015]